MYAAAFFPKSWIPKGPLVAPDYIRQVNNLFADDWDKINQYAQKNNP